MILRIFRRLKSDKGAVEFIESTIVFSILMFMISLLIIITLITIKQVMKKEILYNESLSCMYEKGHDDINSRLRKLAFKEDYSIKKDGGFIASTVKASEDSNVIININRFDTLGLIRKVDFIKYLYEDNSSNPTLNSIKSHIQSYLDAINKFKGLIK